MGVKSTALVDSGYHTHSEQTVELVRTALSGRPLDILVNTHLHSDHCGGNAALQEAFSNLTTLIPPGKAPSVTEWDPIALTYQPTGQHCPRFTFDGALQPGTHLDLGDLPWQVLGAPGHDPDAVILFEERSRTLISGDALWENGFGVVFPELEGDRAFDDVAATLDIIEKLAPRVLVPGHGAVTAYDAALMERARRRLDSFVKDPERHARHAAKVLLKFRLLQVQADDWMTFKHWAMSTSYLENIRVRFFAPATASEFIELLTDELINVGAARREANKIFNG